MALLICRYRDEGVDAVLFRGDVSALQGLRETFRGLAEGTPERIELRGTVVDDDSLVVQAVSVPEPAEAREALLVRTLKRVCSKDRRMGLRFVDAPGPEATATWTLERGYWQMFAELLDGVLAQPREGAHCCLPCSYADDANVTVELCGECQAD